VAAEAGTIGAVYNTSNTLRDDGLYDARLVYRASKPVSIEFSSTEGPLDASESILYRNNLSKIDSPAGVDGLYNTSNSFNEDGTYNGTLTYSKGIAAEHHETWESDNQTNDLYIYRNQETVSIPGTSVYNRNNLSVSINRDGTYDTVFTSVDNGTNTGIPPGESAVTSSVYLYNKRDREYLSWSKAWTRSRSEAADFAAGTSGLIYGTSWKTVISHAGKYNTDWGRSKDGWAASRVEVY